MSRNKNKGKNELKTDVTTKVFLMMFCGMFIFTFLFHMNRNYKRRIEPPSDKWSKEACVSTADIGTYTRIIMDDSGRILVAHNDGNNARIQMLDSTGHKLSEKSFSAGGDNINNISINECKDNMFLSWNTFKGGKNNLVLLKLDKSLNEISRETTAGMIESKQIDKDLLAVLFEDGVSILDFKNGGGKKVVDIKAMEPSLITGTKKGDNYHVAYKEKDGALKYFKYDGKTMKISGGINTFSQVAALVGTCYFNSAIAVDDNNAYFMLESKKNDKYNEPRCYTIPLSGGETKNNEIRLDGYNGMDELAGSSDKDGARFYANASYRMYRQKNSNIIEFKVKDGVPSQAVRATRSDHGPSLKGVYGNYVSYSDFGGNKGKQSLFICSSNGDFKAANAGIKPQERKMALGDVLGDLMNSFAYMFVFGIRWLLPGFALISFVSFFNFKMDGRMKNIMFGLVYAVTFLIMLQSIDQMMYFKQNPFLVSFLKNREFGLFLIAALSALSLSYGIRQYGKDKEEMPLKTFMGALFINTILVQFIFVPFI